MFDPQPHLIKLPRKVKEETIKKLRVRPPGVTNVLSGVTRLVEAPMM